MSQLLRNIDSIIGAFDKFAKQDGDCATLSKAELKQLIQKEFAEVIVSPHDSRTIETVFQLLDADGNGLVDFEEFTVLVFRVARACYKKEHEDQTRVEAQLESAGGLHSPSQGKRTPSRGSPRRSTQQPQIPGKYPDCCAPGELQASSQERHLGAGRHRCSQEPTCQTFERSSGSGPAQRPPEEHQQAGWGLSHQQVPGSQRTEQDPTQQWSPEPQSQAERWSRRCVGEAQPQEGVSAQEHPARQQSLAPESHQPQQQGRVCRQERKPQTSTEQPPAQQHEVQQNQGQAQEVQRRGEEVTSPRAGGSQETVRESKCGRVQECQSLQQRGTRKPSQDCQEEWALAGPRQEMPLTRREQCPTHQREQNLQREEHLTQRQECEPLAEEEGPAQEHRSSQQGTAQASSQRSQAREQSLTSPQVQKPQARERPTLQRTQETEECSSWRQTQGAQRGRQEVDLSKESQETVQERNCGQVQEPQASEQRGSRQGAQDSQVEQSSPDLQQDKPLTCPEQGLSHQREQRSWTGERPTRQQEREPLTQGEVPTHERGSAQQSTTQQASRQPRQQEHKPQTPGRCSAQAQNPQVPEQTPTCQKECEPLTQEQGPNRPLEEASLKPEVASSQQPTPAGQRREQVSTGQFQRETQTERERPIRQQERPSSQGLEKDRPRQREQEPQPPQQARAGHQEHECLASAQLPAGQQEPQAPTERPSCHQERKPEQSRFSTGESKPQTTDRGQRCESTETASALGPRGSPAQQGFKPSRLPSQRSQRLPQSTSSWTSRQ